MTDEAEESWIEVGRFAGRNEAGENALVLVAAGIDCQLASRDGSIGLLVAAPRAAEARRELAAYAADMRPDAEPRPQPVALADPLTGVLAYWCLMVFVYAAASQNAFGLDWFSAGEAQAGAIVDGQWWRAVTALGLHANLGHLLSNLVAGSLFGFFLAEILGAGLAWLMILIAGSVGDAINAWLQPASHTAVGASTAVFGAIGLLAVVAVRFRPQQWRRGLRRWAPLGGGVMLLAFLGIEGENIDVGAHLAGFFVGCLIGAGFLVAGVPAVTPRRTAAFAIGALALFAGAWLVALSHGAG